MKFRKLGNSGIDVSVIGHGTWGLGNDMFGVIDEGMAIKAIHASLDGGVNLIDTAPAYGEDHFSEKLVGRALEGRRSQAIIATKTGVLRLYGAYVRTLNPAVMRVQLEKSLQSLKTDYIDLYQIHWPDYNNSMEAALEEMVKFKKEGKIRAIGVSNFSTEQIQTAVDIADIASIQPQLSILSRKVMSDGILSFCADKNVGILPYGPLAGGILTGKIKSKPTGEKDSRASFYPFYDEPMWSQCQELLKTLQDIANAHNASIAEVSINWVLAWPGVSSALLGSSKPSTAQANIKAADWSLNKEEIQMVENAYKNIFEHE